MGNCNNKSINVLEEQIINLRKENYLIKNELEQEKLHVIKLEKLLFSKKKSKKIKNNFYTDLINSTINKTNLKSNLNILLDQEINHLTNSDEEKVIYKTVYTSVIKIIDYVIKNKI